jgi:hypothetical protein
LIPARRRRERRNAFTRGIDATVGGWVGRNHVDFALSVGLLVNFDVRGLKHGIRPLWLPPESSSSPALPVCSL